MKKVLRGFSLETVDEVKQAAIVADPTPEKTQEQRQQTVVISGPLSEVYTKALDIVFSKDSDVINKLEVSTETQANDAIMNAAITAAVAQREQIIEEAEEEQVNKSFEPFKITNQANTFIYAINPNQMSLEDLTEMAGEFGVASSLNPDAQIVLFADGASEPFKDAKIEISSGGEPNADTFSPVADATRAVVKQMGIQVATSLESLVKIIKK